MGGIGGLLAYFVGGILIQFLWTFRAVYCGAIATTIALITVLIFVKEPKKSMEKQEKQPGLFANIKALLDNPDKSGILY